MTDVFRSALDPKPEDDHPYGTPTERRAPRPPLPAGLAGVHREFTAESHESGLDFGPTHDEFTAVFLAALATKPFVVFTGLSGAGKTSLASVLGQWFGRDRYLVVPVRPDWTSPQVILGFEDLGAETHDSVHSWSVPRTLEFVLTAMRNPTKPYLMVFDEMNLAHIEHYFADVLSGMESNQPVVPNLMHDGRGWRPPRNDVSYLPWPKNIFIVGTLNYDETTYHMSPKVHDRATSIEFRVPPGALRLSYREAREVRRGDDDAIAAFLHRAHGPTPEYAYQEHLALALQQLHNLLFDHEVEFGHRVHREGIRFGSLLADAGIEDFFTILDYVVLYKVMPRLERPGMMTLDLLQELAGYAANGPGKRAKFDPQNPDVDPHLPNTFDKLRRMDRLRLRAKREDLF